MRHHRFRSLWPCAAVAALAASCVDASDDAAPDPGSPTTGALPPDGALGTARIRTAHGVVPVTYQVVDGRPVVGGDIELQPEMIGDRRHAAPAAGVLHWNGGVVPYEIGDVANPQRIHDAIAEYQRRTSIRLVPRSFGDSNWLRFVRLTDAGCGRSRIGRGASGAQVVELADGANCDAGVVIHEIAHAVGVWHEQSRADRRFVVEILWDNIESGQAHNFEVQDVDESLDPGPYDVGSIMHYGATAFGIPDPITGQRMTTIARLDGLPLVTQRSHLSDGDLRSLASYYPPPTQEAPAACRTAPQRGPFRLRADLAEVWQDVGPTTSIATHASTGVGFSAPAAWATRAGGWPLRARWAAGDYDGDGDQDLVAAWNDGGLNTLTVRRSNGGQFLTPAHWRARTGTWLDAAEWIPGDFNGDGRTDLMSVWNDAGFTTLTFWRSTGTTFATPVAWAVRQGTWNAQAKWNVADFNNDGRDDILAALPFAGSTTYDVRISTGSTLIKQQWLAQAGGWASSMQWLVGDFDGNSGPDVMAVWNDAGAASLTFFRNLGGSFAPGVAWAVRDGGWAPNMRWTAGDFDADGRDDVAAAWNDAGMHSLAVRRSTGAGFVTGQWRVRANGWSDLTTWCAGAFDAQ